MRQQALGSLPAHLGLLFALTTVCIDGEARCWAAWLGWRATRGDCLQGLFAAVFRQRQPPIGNPKRRVSTRVRTARCDCPRLRLCPGGKRLWVGTSWPPYNKRLKSSQPVQEIERHAKLPLPLSRTMRSEQVLRCLEPNRGGGSTSPEATTSSPVTPAPRTRTPPRAAGRCGRQWRRRSGRRGNRAPSERLEAAPRWPSQGVAADALPRIPVDYLDTLGRPYALSSVARCRYRESKAFCCPPLI